MATTMAVTYGLIGYVLILFVSDCCSSEISRKNRTESRGLSMTGNCPDFGEIEHGTVTRIEASSIPALRIECNPEYDLIGRPKVLCNDGQWEKIPKPQCAKRCPQPPFVRYAEVRIEGRNEDKQTFRKGTLATYSCDKGFELVPSNSKYRECKDGVWTGIQGTCVSNGCPWPANIANGYYVLETPQGNMPDSSTEHKQVHVGQRAHYNCNLGYILTGDPIMQCIETGEWSPRIPPVCTEQPQLTEDPESPQLCPPAPAIPHTTLTTQEGVQTANNADAGARLEVRCQDGYRDSSAPCAPFVLTCEGGEWKGRIPHCVPVKGCLPPPSIPHGALFGLAPDGVYEVHAQVAYTCPPGYVLQGDQMLSCSPSGCWEPNLLPVCRMDPQFFVSPRTLADYLSTSSILLVSMATALGVMLILLGVCLVVVCRRRRHRPWLSLHHHRSPRTRGSTASVGVAAGLGPVSSPGVATASVTSSASNTLLHDPDRVALIAYADGVQLGESTLPSYEEAVRERPPGLLAFRSHGRPQWTALGAARRGRGPDAVHVTRQSSSTSHSVSTGDSMGSTDTMTPSEVSTNVTLDTVSSHTCSSSSQTASCRAICGSLASFDTSSVLNTEGVPLLEENELEDGMLMGTAPVMGLDTPDCGSYKYRRTSPDLA